MVIRSEGESFVVVQIEETYNLICSIASSDKTVTKQLQYILNQQHVFFKLFHKTLTTINKEPGLMYCEIYRPNGGVNFYLNTI